MATKRRERRARQGGGAPVTEPAPQVAVTLPMPVWQWKTFPVFFAFAVGAFVGVYAGFIAGAVGDETASLVMFIAVAVLLGFALSRFTTRWMMAHNWVRPRKRRAKR